MVEALHEDHSEQDLRTLYENRFEGRQEYRLKVWSILVSSWFSRFVPIDGTILDLGCGYGEFINQAVAKSRYAMDLNPDSRRYLDPAVRLFEQDCSERWPLEDRSLDLVFTSNFFEHLESKAKLAATLREACRCLRPGGRLVALGPNIKYVPGAYWDFWDHHIPLSEASLAEGLRAAGFQVETIIPRFLPYTMSQGPQYPLFLFRLYLKLPFAWRFLGRQFLVVAKK